MNSYLDKILLIVEKTWLWCKKLWSCGLNFMHQHVIAICCNEEPTGRSNIRSLTVCKRPWKVDGKGWIASPEKKLQKNAQKFSRCKGNFFSSKVKLSCDVNHVWIFPLKLDKKLLENGTLHPRFPVLKWWDFDNFEWVNLTDWNVNFSGKIACFFDRKIQMW